MGLSNLIKKIVPTGSSANTENVAPKVDKDKTNGIASQSTTSVETKPVQETSEKSADANTPRMTFQEYRSAYLVSNDQKLAALGAPDDSLIETPDLTERRLKAEAKDLEWYFNLKTETRYDEAEDEYFNSEEFDPNTTGSKKTGKK